MSEEQQPVSVAERQAIASEKGVALLEKTCPTLRDYFAMAALTGILGSRTGFLIDVGTKNAPQWAYQVADGMLAERLRVVDEYEGADASDAEA